MYRRIYQFHGGTTSGALSAMNTTMARVNGVFEKDVCLRMVMIDNNDDVIFLNGSTDPYTNSNGATMLSQNQAHAIASLDLLTMI